jgi:sugar lactone lactonase YvrE
LPAYEEERTLVTMATATNISGASPVLNPQGKLIGKVLLPKQTANLTFGGKDNNVLLICSSDSIWAIKLNAQGAKPIPILPTSVQK